MRPQIVEALGRADRPLTLRELQALVPGVGRPDLEALVERGVVHPCTRARYWDRDETDHHLAFVRAALEQGPLTRRAIATALGERDPSLPQAWRLALYARLRDSEGVWEWPGGAGQRSPRLATDPPDPEAYVGRVRAQYERVRDRLARAGVDERTIASSVIGTPSGEPARGPVPSPNVLNELAFAWADAAEGARPVLERVLINIGARRLLEVDASVAFDGRLHETEDDLFPDEPARVVEPGWVHGTAQSRVIL
ncbi:MAG: hypothetical protein AAF602_30780, partial [Myxococcota bacterium]